MIPASRRSLAIIFFILLMDVIGITILYPVAPFIVRRYSSRALDVTLLTVIYASAQFFAAPAMGKLGDRFGRRPVLLVSVAGSMIGYVIFGLGGSLWILFLSRLIDGITGGNASTASSYIADISQPEERARNFTLIGLAWGLGLIIGPALGAVFGQIHLNAPAYTAATLSLISLLLVYFYLPESLPRKQRLAGPIRATDLNPFASIRQMLIRPGLGWLLLILCLFNFAFNGINNTETLFLIRKFDAQPWQVGLQLVLLGLALALVQTTLIPRLVPRFGEKRVAVISLVGQAIGDLATFFAPIFWMIYPITFINRGISGFIFPTLTTLITNRVSPQELGVLMGVSTALGSLMNILGPLWAGAAFDRVMPGSPYWIGAAIFLAAAMMLAHKTPK